MASPGAEISGLISESIERGPLEGLPDLVGAHRARDRRPDAAVRGLAL